MNLFVSQLQLRPLRSVLLWVRQVERARNFSSKKKSSGKVKQPPADIEIKPLRMCDEEATVKFLRLFYYSEEPLSVGLDPVGLDIIDERYVIDLVAHEMSFKALLKMNDKPRMVGVIVAGPKYPWEAQRRYDDYCKFGGTKMGLTQKLAAKVEWQANVFERFNVKEVIHVEAVATDTTVRGRAIGLRLMKEIFKYVKRLNYKVVTVDATSKYSALFCDKLGMELLATAYYKDYVDDKGKPIFTPPQPHDAIKAYAQRL